MTERLCWTGSTIWNEQQEGKVRKRSGKRCRKRGIIPLSALISCRCESAFYLNKRMRQQRLGASVLGRRGRGW